MFEYLLAMETEQDNSYGPVRNHLLMPYKVSKYPSYIQVDKATCDVTKTQEKAGFQTI